MAYRLIWETAGVVFYYTGKLTDADLVRSNEEVCGDSRAAALRYQLVDLSGIEAFHASTQTVRRMAIMDQQASLQNPAVKVAIVTNEVFLRGMSNVYGLTHEAAGGTWQMQQFETQAAAREWLCEEEDERPGTPADSTTSPRE